MRRRLLVSLALILAIAVVGWYSRRDIAAAASLVGRDARVQRWRTAWLLARTGFEARRDVPYVVRGADTLRLDLYLPRARRGRVPLLLYFHGGGWVEGSKEDATFDAATYTRLGAAVANVEYRLAQRATAPGAIEDARCALYWVHARAQSLGIDTARIVATGISAGGHLALMAALARPEDGFDDGCVASRSTPRVLAVATMAAPVDLRELAATLGGQWFLHAWLGTSAPDSGTLDRLSPLEYVRPGAPRVIAIQGDRDVVVRPDAALRLHAALDRVGVPNRLVVLAGEGHALSHGAATRAHRAITDYLRGVLATD